MLKRYRSWPCARVNPRLRAAKTRVPAPAIYRKWISGSNVHPRALIDRKPF
ncbi:hypothetical protein BSU04_00045 [Caballeronia sordidicola]|uniref:Uncharacterized protein n=1 Tax=Caballeronia sordidicola TaxID=196367 RepID=A0A226XB78_CABSO|nr:hypothetical protein BSU04_00045 [Caballeronia sordidicola]